MPFPEPFTGDAAFDAVYLVRPPTDTSRALVTKDLRRALLQGAPKAIDVDHGVVTMPLGLTAGVGIDVEREHVRAIGDLVACIRGVQTPSAGG